MPQKHDTTDEDDDLYLFAAMKLQDGVSVAKVRGLLEKKNVSAEEARTMVLNVYAAQLLQNGRKPSEVRKLLVKEDATVEEARAIVAEMRQATEEPAAEETGGGSGSAMRGWGIMLLILGIGSFVLPFLGVQFRLLAIFGIFAPVLGGILAVVGAVLLILSFQSR